MRRDHVLHGADGKPCVGKIEIFAPHAEAAPVAAGPTGIRDKIESQQAGREFGFDDLDRGDPGIALIDRDPRCAVLAGAGATRHDLVLNVVAVRIGVTSAQDDGPATAAVGTRPGRCDMAQGGENCIHQGMDGRIVSVDRRRETRIEDAAFPYRDREALQQSAADVHLRVNQRDETVSAGRLHQRRTDVSRALGLVGGAREVKVQRITVLLDNDMDAHWPLQLDPVVVDEALRLKPSIVPAGDRELHTSARHFEQPVIAGADLCWTVFSYQRDQPPFAEPVSTELAANVAEHQFGRAAVDGDDAFEIVIGDVAALIAHRRELETLVEDFTRLAGAASRHRSPDIALVSNAATKAKQRIFDEYRRDHRNVGSMRAAAVIRVIDQKSVAFRDRVAKRLEDGGAAGWECPDMKRQHYMLGDDGAVVIHQSAGGILGFADDSGETCAKQCILHFLDDAAQARFDDFEVDRIDGSGERHDPPSAMMMFFHASTRAVWPGQTTVVQSNWSRIAGPCNTSPTSRRSRW